MNKEILIIDHDDTLTDFIPSLLDYYNWDADDNLKPEDITDWDLSLFVKPEFKERIYQYLVESYSARIIFENAKPMENSIEVTKWLQDIFDIWIVSATHPFNVRYKAEQICEYYPHISITKRYCIHPDKTLFRAKKIIDDKFSTVNSFQEGLLMNKPWNNKYSFALERRMNNWLEIQTYYQNLIDCGKLKKEVA